MREVCLETRPDTTQDVITRLDFSPIDENVVEINYFVGDTVSTLSLSKT